MKVICKNNIHQNNYSFETDMIYEAEMYDTNFIKIYSKSEKTFDLFNLSSEMFFDMANFNDYFKFIREENLKNILNNI